jgi:hypothetical protein
MPPVTVESHIQLHVEALTVGEGPASPTGVSRNADLGPRKPEILAFHVPWGAEGHALDVSLKVTLVSAAPSDLVVRCAATVVSAGRPAVQANRDIHFADEGSAVFEVYGDGDGRLLLTLQGERAERAVAGPIPPPGDSVRFTVAVEGVEGDRSAVLETNELHTFVGQSVEYSFQQGPEGNRESVRLVLIPESISGDLVTIRAEISGVIPGPNGPAMISRSDRIVASRRATTAVAATVGTPPSGYRFQVTPDF